MRIKRRLRTVLESAAFRTGVLARFERRAHAGLTILTYHRVLADDACDGYPFPSLAMHESAFRAQVAWLARHFEVMPVGEALVQHHRPQRGGKPLCALTFDDGYVDNAVIAAPILKSHGLRATFFVVSGFVSSGDDLWFDRAMRLLRELGQDRDPASTLELLKRMNPAARDHEIADWEARASEMRGEERAHAERSSMTRDHLADLVRAGHEIGSHSANHPILVNLGDDELERELSVSKRELETWLGVPVRGFAYPNGDSDARVREFAQRAGYAWACTTTAGRNTQPIDPLALQRIDVTPARVSDHAGSYAEIAFRSEISLMRHAMRGSR